MQCTSAPYLESVLCKLDKELLHLFSQKTVLLMKVIMTCFDIKLWDILCCFHYILNSPRTCFKKGVFILNDQFDKEVSYHVENIQHKDSGFYLFYYMRFFTTNFVTVK